MHAVRGDRARYAPVRSVLCETAEPTAVVRALRARLGVSAFYVADLDAIQQRGSARALVAALVSEHCDCQWWIDAGFGEPSRLEPYLQAANVRAIVGSESLADATALAELRAALPRPASLILSLDHRRGEFIGPPALLDSPGLWPSTVIAMNLDRVGAAEGPDLALIAALRARAPAVEVVAAGGVRDARDLATLAASGTAQALIATALHSGLLTREDLQRVAG